MFTIGAFVILIGLCRTYAQSDDNGFYFGCYTKANGFAKNSPSFAGSADKCIDACIQDYFRYAILSADPTCSCSNLIAATELNRTDCDQRCSENPEQWCGGPNAQSYYVTDLQLAGPPSNILLTNRTSTSLTIHWTPPERQDLLKQYLVVATVKHSFEDSALPPPQWIVQKTESHIDIPNLHPGTTYNFTIISDSIGGKGGRRWAVFSTEIGVPDPQPEQPKVIDQTDSTRVIEIKPATNRNGPVSCYWIIVIFVDSGLVQSFDERLIKRYAQAQEDGTNYYIAAEIELAQVSRRFTVGDGRTYAGYENPPLPPDSHVHVSIGVVSTQDATTKVRYSATTHEQHDVMIVVDDAEDESKALLITLVVACIIFGLLLVFSVIVYFYLRIRMDRRLQRLPSDHHELTLQGPIIEVENNGYIPDDYMIKENYELKLAEILNRLDANQKFTRKSLELDVNHVIGSGNFGDVIRGHLQMNRMQVHVISDDMEPLDQSQFLKDFDQILNVASHRSVLSFVGVCQTPDWLYLLFEDTPSTLKKRLVEARVPPDVDAHRFSHFSEEFVLRILFEIADAMEYLSMQQFVHRKLCSFNIRMTIDDEIKISAFGATPFDDQRHTIDLARWSAPEVLRFQHYSVKSDVWSFGCLMWECCCLGGTLYANISSGDLIQRIKSGTRPDHVPFVYDDMYQLMLNCWEVDPSERPSFADISFALRQMLTSPQHVLSFNRQDGIILPYYLPLLEIQNST